MVKPKSFLFSSSVLSHFANEFHSELVKASTGGDGSSVSYIRQNPSLPSSSDGRDIDSNKNIQVFIVGGSVFEKARLTFKGGKPILSQIEKSPITKLSSKKVFLDFLESHIDTDTELIGLNFAFAMESVEREGLLDGKLKMAAKEHDFKGLIGQFVGLEIEKYVAKVRGQKIRVAVANDTVCLSLSDFESNPQETVALIVGTGYNIALFDDYGNIVNTESGNFDKFTRTFVSKLIDGFSNTKGFYYAEKEIAGKYLFKHYNIYQSAIGSSFMPLESTKGLSAVASGEEEYSFDEVSLARILLERSASLVASNIAGVVKFKKMEKINLIVEGSLFWKGYLYKDNFERYFKLLTKGNGLKHIQIKMIENSGLLGAGRLLANLV